MPDISPSPNASGAGGKQPVVFIHDAATDDFVATLLLVAMPTIDLKGIVITNADCIAEPAMDVASRVQQFIDRPDIPLALSSARGWNPFPWQYRGDCVALSATPILQPYRSTVPTPPPSGDDLLVRLLKDAIASGCPLTVLITTAFTPLTDILLDQPELTTGIGQVVWMGGAVDVAGNLDATVTNPAVANQHAEWNAFFDPFAVDYALKHLPNINVFPLDITNSAAITPSFLASLKAQGATSSFSQFAFEAYSLVVNEPYYDMWNVCATCWLAAPGLYAPAQRSALDIVQWGFEQGWLRRAPAGPSHNLFLGFRDKGGFYSYIVAQLARSA